MVAALHVFDPPKKSLFTHKRLTGLAVKSTGEHGLGFAGFGRDSPLSGGDPQVPQSAAAGAAFGRHERGIFLWELSGRVGFVGKILK